MPAGWALRRWAWRAAAGLVLTAWLVLCRPVSLGGGTGYVMVRGISMQPTFRSGDLVVTRARPHYRVGDVVAYRVPDGQIGAGLLVIHRITGGTARDGYTLQGDNNPVADDWRPRPGDIVGVARLHIPGAGRLLALLRAPALLASLATGAAVAVVLVPGRMASPEGR